MTENGENLWARRPHGRHAELYDAEYAKQLERIARIRSEVSNSLPDAPPPPPAEEPPPRKPAGARWDAAPENLVRPDTSRPARRRGDALAGRASPPADTPAPLRGRIARRLADMPAPGRLRPADTPAPLHGPAAPRPVDVPAGLRSADTPGPARDPAPLRPADTPAPLGGPTVPRPADTVASILRPSPLLADPPAPVREPAARRPATMPARLRGLAALHPADAIARLRGPRPGDPSVHGPAARPGDGAADSGAARTAPRARDLIVAASLLVVLAGAAVAVLAGRSPDAPAPTVFRVPGQPTGLVASEGQVWVAGPASGAVWVLDGASGRPAAPALRPGGTPARIALDRRFAWIADTQRGAVVRAPRSGSGPQRLVRAGPDVADLVVAANAVWTASSADGTVRVLDADGRRSVLQVGGRPIALSADAGHVVAVGSAGTLIRLTARTRRADGPPLDLGGSPVDVALVGDRAWVADASAGTVRSVALSSGRAADAVQVCRSPVAIAADAAGVYVLCRGDRTLVRLDASGAVRSRVRLAQTPTALALDSRHIWIAAGSNEVIRVDR